MRKYFDHAFQGLRNTMESIADFANCLATAAIVTAVYATIPLWIVPYLIFYRESEESED